MKLKYVIMASLMLAVMMVGAVSASDDMASNDTVSEIANNDDFAINEISEDDDSLSSDENEVVSNNDGAVSSEGDVEVLGSADDDVVSSDDGDAEVLSSSDDSVLMVSSDDEDEILGDYYGSGVHIQLNNEVDLSDSYDSLGYIEDNNGIKGVITVKIDGKKVFTKKFTKGNTYYYSMGVKTLNLKKYGFGTHTVKVTYNDGKERSDSRKITFMEVPSVRVPYHVAVNEKAVIIIKGMSNQNGTATLYKREVTKYDEYGWPTAFKKGKAVSHAKIINGFAAVPITFKTNGTFYYQLEYTFGDYKGVKTSKLNIYKNTPGYKSSVSSTSLMEGKSVTVKVTGSVSNDYLSMYIDNKFVKDIKMSSGSIEEVFSGLSEGTHYINCYLNDYESSFFSNTHKVVVKPSVYLTLKKVVPKKTAKKLTLTASLKIYKKAAKNKKVTFKFNKKTYKVKTNKKGIAKLTIKKSILKKLKVGKKITYQVTYGKKTVKYTVKVKK